eukprot:900610_1
MPWLWLLNAIYQMGAVYNKLTTTDKVLSMLGFGRVWFVINSWSESQQNPVYFQLYNKHKIWDLMYENIPTVALQVYAALVMEGNTSLAIIISITISVLSMSYTTWMYLVNITSKKMTAAKGNKVEDNTISVIELETQTQRTEITEQENEEKNASKLPQFIINKFGTALENKLLFLNLYVWMISDFYIRTIPLVTLIASIPCSNGDGGFCYLEFYLFSNL